MFPAIILKVRIANGHAWRTGLNNVLWMRTIPDGDWTGAETVYNGRVELNAIGHKYAEINKELMF